MVRLADLPAIQAQHILAAPCAEHETTPQAAPPPKNELRLALVTTAGLHLRSDRPFGLNSADYRIIGGQTPAAELVMSHVSTNFDRSGFQEDINVVLPLDRARELAEAGEIGSLADYHYSFMGGTEAERMEPAARELAGLLKGDRVNGVLLIPV